MSDLNSIEKNRKPPVGKKPVPLVYYKGTWLSEAGPQSPAEKKIYDEALRNFGAENLPKQP